MTTAQILAIVTDMQKTLNLLVQKVDSLDDKISALDVKIDNTINTIGNTDIDSYYRKPTIHSMVTDLKDAVIGTRDVWGDNSMASKIDDIANRVKIIDNDMPRLRY